MRIIRHIIGITDYQEIEKPYGELLSVAVSRTAPNLVIDLWSIDLEDGQQETVGIYVVGTGNQMPEALSPRRSVQFIGTIVTPNDLVWHVFGRPVR